MGLDAGDVTPVPGSHEPFRTKYRISVCLPQVIVGPSDKRESSYKDGNLRPFSPGRRPIQGGVPHSSTILVPLIRVLLGDGREEGKTQYETHRPRTLTDGSLWNTDEVPRRPRKGVPGRDLPPRVTHGWGSVLFVVPYENKRPRHPSRSLPTLLSTRHPTRPKGALRYKDVPQDSLVS